MKNNTKRNGSSALSFAWITLILTILIPIFVLNIPVFREFTRLEIFGYSLGFISLITSMFLFLYSNLESKVKETSEAHKQLEESIVHLGQAFSSSKNSTYAISKEELYHRMNGFVQSSKKRINLMYMGTKPPTDYGTLFSKIEYITSLGERISSNNIPIKRIILYTETNKQWIKELSEFYNQKDNVSLYIIADSGSANMRSVQVSVQLFDDSKVVLMNFDNSNVSTGGRDIIIDSIELTRIFESYYERFITTKVAIPIIENGRLNQENSRKYL